MACNEHKQASVTHDQQFLFAYTQVCICQGKLVNVDQV